MAVWSRRFWWGLVLALCTYGMPARAGGEAESAEALLRRVDQAIPPGGKVWVIDMRVIGNGGDVRHASLLLIQGGSTKRILRFLDPPQMRNTALLTLGADDFYVFMGQEGRTRRLGSSAFNQTFFGSDYTFEDLSSIYFSGRFTPRIVGREGSEILLELKPNGPATWSRIVLFVNEENALVRRAEYYDLAGRHARTQMRRWRRDAVYERWVPTQMLMVNEQTKHATELMLHVADADRPIPNEVFSLRGLQRGDDLSFKP